MPDVSALLRRSAVKEAVSYQPSPDLPRRIARRTLQLQRQRRARVVGGAAILTAAILAFTLVVRPATRASNTVSIAAGPVNLAAKDADESTLASTTTTIVPLQLLDLQGFIDQGIAARNQTIRQFVAALKKQQQRERDAAAKAQGDAEVLDASIARGPTFAGFLPATPTTKKGDDPTSTTSSTRPTGTTTTTEPPTTTTTEPTIPLRIVPPDHVCAGIPAVFHATGTGADQVQWSNAQTGATAVYVLTESATITARLQLGGATSTQAYGAQVIPTGTPPC